MVYRKRTNCYSTLRKLVSLTMVCSTITKTGFRLQGLRFLRDKNVLCAKQYGFQMGGSTRIQFWKTLDDFTLTQDRVRENELIYSNFEKANDIVPHRRLKPFLEKMAFLIKALFVWILFGPKENEEWLSMERFRVGTTIGCIPQNR